MEADSLRDFDIVVYGATGFTGALVAEYLQTHHSHSLRPEFLRAAPRQAPKGLRKLVHRLGAQARHQTHWGFHGWCEYRAWQASFGS